MLLKVPKLLTNLRQNNCYSRKLILTCLITGFYPKDVKMSLRKFTTSFPDHLITSSGIRLNHNGTYQLRKSVEIQEDDSGDYSCYVSHKIQENNGYR
uniref:Ig-like domain-containing protein n=1 Tax=Astyanax mexicanus TaxID=7994 RepID=A0A3B1JG36_ASTMX